VLVHKLRLRDIEFERQLELPVKYKGLNVDAGFRMDLVVKELIVVELKSVDRLGPIHTAQMLTDLRLSGHWLGLLMNFNVAQMRFGIKRLVSGTPT
jgi:GxxExxY protein